MASHLELPDPALLGVGERALLVTEELALDQFARNSRTIHTDEGLCRSITLIMKKSSKHLLSCSALARNEHRGPRGCNSFNSID